MITPSEIALIHTLDQRAKMARWTAELGQPMPAPDAGIEAWQRRLDAVVGLTEQLVDLDRVDLARRALASVDAVPLPAFTDAVYRLTRAELDLLAEQLLDRRNTLGEAAESAGEVAEDPSVSERVRSAALHLLGRIVTHGVRTQTERRLGVRPDEVQERLEATARTLHEDGHPLHAAALSAIAGDLADALSSRPPEAAATAVQDVLRWVVAWLQGHLGGAQVAWQDLVVALRSSAGPSGIDGVVPLPSHAGPAQPAGVSIGVGRCALSIRREHAGGYRIQCDTPTDTRPVLRAGAAVGSQEGSSTVLRLSVAAVVATNVTDWAVILGPSTERSSSSRTS